MAAQIPTMLGVCPTSSGEMRHEAFTALGATALAVIIVAAIARPETLKPSHRATLSRFCPSCAPEPEARLGGAPGVG